LRYGKGMPASILDQQAFRVLIWVKQAQAGSKIKRSQANTEAQTLVVCRVGLPLCELAKSAYLQFRESNRNEKFW
jgi:hypothetical protein